jgi:aminoglycoside phosphotransferase (APT) family kinase protein
VEPELVTGGTLVHTDVTTKNFLIDGDTVAVVDWAIPCRGAGWLDTALMAIRLVRAGHSPAGALRWAERVPTWRAASTQAVRAFATACADLGAERARQSAAPHLRQLADAAADWASFLTNDRSHHEVSPPTRS